LTGLGEVVGFPAVGVVREILNQAKPVFIGQDPHEIERIRMRFYGLAGWHLYRQLGNIVLAGVEMALWDIMGKEVGKPIHALLGGKVRDRISYVYYMPQGDKDEIIERSKNVIQKGFNTLFVKVIDPEDTVSLIRDLRTEVGKDPKIRIDPNESWTVGTAIKTIRRLEPLDLEAVEQPISIYDLPGMVRVRNASRIPIILDQACMSDYDVMKLIRSEAGDILTADPYYLGGLWSCKLVAAAANLAGLPVVLHSYGQLGVGTAACMHLIATCPNYLFANQTHLPIMEDDLLEEPLVFENGSLPVPDKPGLGISLDEEKVAKYEEHFHRNGEYTHFTELSPGMVPWSPRF
jgi:L-alanine-DL-glutamate epimerase-like enolase superfamily enzyme